MTFESLGQWGFGSMRLSDYLGDYELWDRKNFGPLAIGSLFLWGKTFRFEKTLLVKVYVYVVKYSTITVGIETMGQQDHINLKPWKFGTLEP